MKWYKVAVSLEHIRRIFKNDKGYLEALEHAKTLPPDEAEKYILDYEEFLIDRYYERGE